MQRDKTAPKRVFHLAPECAIGSIMADGLKGMEGVYACSTPEATMRFAGWRAFDHMHITERTEENPMGFEVIAHDLFYIVEIDTAFCPEEWVEGTDHNPEFFGDDSWLHPGKVPATAIVGVEAYERAEKNNGD